MTPLRAEYARFFKLSGVSRGASSSRAGAAVRVGPPPPAEPAADWEVVEVGTARTGAKSRELILEYNIPDRNAVQACKPMSQIGGPRKRRIRAACRGLSACGGVRSLRRDAGASIRSGSSARTARSGREP